MYCIDILTFFHKDDRTAKRQASDRVPSPVISATVKREEETTDDEDYGNTKSPITKPKRKRFIRRNDLMIWARDSDNVNAETYLAYLDEEANNDEKEGSERVWIRWDTNLGRKVCLHQSRIVDKLTSRQVKRLKVSGNKSKQSSVQSLNRDGGHHDQPANEKNGSVAIAISPGTAAAAVIDTGIINNNNTVINNNTISITVFKPFKDSMLGLDIAEVKGASHLILVTSIDKDSLFRHSELKVGMVFHSINNKTFTSFREGLALLKSAVGKFTIEVFRLLRTKLIWINSSVSSAKKKKATPATNTKKIVNATYTSTTGAVKDKKTPANVVSPTKGSSVISSFKPFSNQVLSPDLFFGKRKAAPSKRDKVVKSFFQRLIGCNCFSTSPPDLLKLENDIKTHPYLLNQRCPIDHQIKIRPGRGGWKTIKTECRTALEIMCLDDFHCDDGLEMLWKLICLGAKTTEDCYWGIVDSSSEDIVEHFIALLCAGNIREWQMIYEGHQYRPEQYFLDDIVKGIYWWVEEGEGDKDYLIQIFDIMFKRVKMGDEIIGYGKVDNPIILNNINELRALSIGGTHAKGGALDELMGELYPEKAAAMRRLAVDSDEDDSIESE